MKEEHKVKEKKVRGETKEETERKSSKKTKCKRRRWKEGAIKEEKERTK